MTPSCSRLWQIPLRETVLSLLMWLCTVVAAHGHASLHLTEPPDGSVVNAAPASIKLHFSEPVSPTRLMMTMPDGSSAALEQFVAKDQMVAIVPPDDLAKGTYLLSWRVVSEDGHPVAGTLVFSIGQPQAAYVGRQDVVDQGVRLGLWLGRVGLYAGLLLGVGGVFAIKVFCAGSRLAARAIGAMLGLGMLGIVISTGFQGLDAVGQSAGAFFRSDIWQAAAATSFGRTAGLAAIAMIMAAGALIGKRPSAQWAAIIALAVAAAAPSLSGHASTAEPRWLMRAAVFVHIAAAAIWAGALIPVAAELRAANSGSTSSLRRFSWSIPLAVLALALTGTALAFVQVRTIQGLWMPYGTVLLTKLGLLVPLLALAAFNRWRLTAGVLRGAKGETAMMVRVILVETLLVLAVLGVVAAWRFTPPPRSFAVEINPPQTIHLHGEQAMAMLTVQTDTSGRTRLSASILGADFSPLSAQEVRFVLSNPTAGIEPITRSAAKDASAVWTTTDLVLPVQGPWRIRLDILVDDFTLYSLEGELPPTR